MGMYLHPGSLNFKTSLNSKIYIDKTKLIGFTNEKLNTRQKYLCVSRPRRFGKTMAADMLAAYYDSKEDTEALFHNSFIVKDESYRRYLNSFNVIKIDMQSFLNKGKSVDGLLEKLNRYLVREFKKAYPQIDFIDEEDLSECCNDILEETQKQFVIIIDEWDCVMRRSNLWEEQKMYLDFLRDWLKDQSYIALAYMTGILPIKKYGEHSTLNMFREYSMVDSAQLSDCFGFTEQEVRELCKTYQRDFSCMQEWYDGYHLICEAEGKKEEYSIYSPNSIVESLERGKFAGYWNQTETYEALKKYIQMNKDGLKDMILQMLSGEDVSINTRHFQNDMSTFDTRDDILTLLVHLGYLSYHQEENTVTIPNKEVAQEFISTIETIPSYNEVNRAIKDSKELLQALWDRNEDVVAKGVEKAHEELSILKYNDENALSCTLQLAFYYAREYYQIIRELPTGKGYADIVFIPRQRCADKPAIIIELKWDKSAETALTQVKKKNYPHALEPYKNNLLICGINYNKKDKKHECKISIKYIKKKQFPGT